jgi:hypothetical protein
MLRSMALDWRCDGPGAANLWGGTNKICHVLSLAHSERNIDAYWSQVKLAVFLLEATKSKLTPLYLLTGRPRLLASATVS